MSADRSLHKKQVNLGNYVISYLEGGASTDQPPIVFLQGWSVSFEPYQRLLQALAQNYWVIAPDLPGFSESTRPKLLENSREYGQCILEFMATLNLKQVHLMGHSLGGAIAISIAAENRSLIASLTLIDSTGIPLGTLPEVLLRRTIEMPAQFSIESPETLWLELFEIPRIFLYNCVFNTSSIIQGLWLSLHEDLRALMPQIQAPCLVIWGENDLASPLALGQEMTNRIPGAQLAIVPGRYHEGVLLHSDQYLPIMLSFIAKLETRVASQH